ncbi:hypothetical protein [Actinoallomurus vinaceus]|uniref:hypothetical protein n=1 Tax=Actinoallomurus vinaceus TaxID=1080074 RepID=UPI0031E7854F
MEVPLGLGDLLVPVQERRQLDVVVTMSPVGDEGVRLQHGLQPPARTAGAVSDLGQFAQVAGDLAGIPGVEDGSPK